MSISLIQPDTTLPREKAVKKYVALFGQSGTSAPVVTVLENSMGGEIVWTRTNVGLYIGTLAGTFTENKTIIFPSNSGMGGLPSSGTDILEYMTYISRIDESSINVTVMGAAYSSVEFETAWGTSQIAIEIRVYA